MTQTTPPPAAVAPIAADVTTPKRKAHPVAVTALVIAAVGFIFACMPGALIVGWVLLPIAFVLSLVAFFLKGKKWPAITALIASIVGTIIGVIVFFAVVATSFDNAFGGTEGHVAPAATDTPAAADDAAVAVPANPGFGETYTYEDGVTITVSAPAAYTPTEYAAGADQANNVTFTFTITNGSKENLDAFTYPQITSGGVEASMIFDNNDAVSGSAPSSTVLPGQSLTWTSAYSVADLNKLQVEVSPASFAYDDAIFTNIAS